MGINDRGEIVGITLNQDRAPDQGYYWNAVDNIGNFTTILGEKYFPFAGISNQGVSAGLSANQNQAQYFAVGEGAAVAIDKLSAADRARVLGLNDQDLIAGESGINGFVYDMTTRALFNMNSFPRLGFSVDQIVRINDINNDGTFIGVALIGDNEYGILGQFVPVPEPTSLALLLTAGCFLICRARNVVGIRPGAVTQSPKS